MTRAELTLAALSLALFFVAGLALGVQLQRPVNALREPTLTATIARIELGNVT